MRKIVVNTRLEKGKLNRYFSNCIGAGRAGEIMRYRTMEQLKTIQSECPFRYIRFHGLFHEEMNIVRRDKDGKLQFCFQYIDILFDDLLKHGIRPVVELGLMPDVLAEDKKYVFWWKMNISMPKDISEWSYLVEELVRHLTKRYGEKEISKWYFEVWNEPNHRSFFAKSDNITEYFKLYDAAALAVKKVDPAYRVGGPATAGMGWIPEMIQHCRKNSIPLDFISSHSYGVKGDFDVDGTAVLVLAPVDTLSDTVRFFGELCKKEGLPLFITEWSSSYSPLDPIHDSYFNAAFILHTIKRCEGYADMFSYWTYTDIFEEKGPPNEPFHGGFGLINVQSIPKPTYYAYTFLNRLGDTEIDCSDSESYACKSSDEVQLLFWNLIEPHNPCINKTYFSKSLPSLPLDDVKIEISELEAHHKYTVSVQTIGYRSGDAYNAYLDEKFTDLPSQEEIDKLIQKSKPASASYKIVTDEQGVLKLTLPQHENQVDFLVIRKS